MHDPMTLAWEIKYPWKRKTAHGSYRDSIVDVWHVDPQKGRGGDDTCGWFSPQLTDDQVKDCEHVAKDLMWDVFPADKEEGKHFLVGDAKSAVYTAYVRVGWRIFKRQELSHKHVAQVLSLMHSHGDYMGFPGSGVSVWDVEQLVCRLAREFAKIERPWWKHPRYHVHHFKVNIHPIMKLKRWLFSRCRNCGKRFVWGYVPTSTCWNSTGPRWFRGETNVGHHDCKRPEWNGCCSAK